MEKHILKISVYKNINNIHDHLSYHLYYMYIIYIYINRVPPVTIPLGCRKLGSMVWINERSHPQPQQQPIDPNFTIDPSTSWKFPFASFQPEPPLCPSDCNSRISGTNSRHCECSSGSFSTPRRAF